MKKVFLIAILIIILIAVGQSDLLGQCPMCKMSAESNLQSGGSAGKGLNAGILYMFCMPYLLVATLGYIWYRNRKTSTEEEVSKWN
ncbi:MAG: hypothetical protein R3275_13880 [Saprospiraceae bacterium]|nr:hypothetical protein [Saprospiraceae bacterium]